MYVAAQYKFCECFCAEGGHLAHVRIFWRGVTAGLAVAVIRPATVIPVCGRDEGVPIIMEDSEALSGRKPQYQLIDDAELLLTIYAYQRPE